MSSPDTVNTVPNATIAKKAEPSGTDKPPKPVSPVPAVGPQPQTAEVPPPPVEELIQKIKEPVEEPEVAESLPSSELKDADFKEEVKSAKSAEIDSRSQTDQWEGFVHYMAGKVNKSLVSLLRNSVLLEMSEDSLAIGFKNTELFSDDKREQVENEAKLFFKKPIKISYKDDTDGIDDSVREKQEQELERQIEAQKKEAAESAKVKEILDLFPGSSISQIRIISEKEDV